MENLSIALVVLIALEHLYILVLEMFLWHKPRTQKIFSIKKQHVQATRVMAANQGLYNGFLAAGLLWGLVHSDLSFGLQIQFFFLVCIMLAGIYGGLTVKKSIIFVQSLPALIAIIVLVLAHA